MSRIITIRRWCWRGQPHEQEKKREWKRKNHRDVIIKTAGGNLQKKYYWLQMRHPTVLQPTACWVYIMHIFHIKLNVLWLYYTANSDFSSVFLFKRLISSLKFYTNACMKHDQNDYIIIIIVNFSLCVVCGSPKMMAMKRWWWWCSHCLTAHKRLMVESVISLLFNI